MHFKPILLRKADTLNGATRNYFEILKTSIDLKESFGNKEMGYSYQITNVQDTGSGWSCSIKRVSGWTKELHEPAVVVCEGS